MKKGSIINDVFLNQMIRMMQMNGWISDQEELFIWHTLEDFIEDTGFLL